MRPCLATIPCLALSLAASACASLAPPSGAAGGPFGAAPAGPGPGPDFALSLGLLAGVGLGLILAMLWRRRRLRRCLRHPQGSWLPEDLSRLRAVQAIVEDLALAADQRGVVVRVKDWLRRKERPPGGRL